MKTNTRTITLDGDLARRAGRKLHRYGTSLNDWLAHSLAYVVNTRGNPWQGGAAYFAVVGGVPPVIEFETHGRRFVADVTPDDGRYFAQVRGCPGCFTEGGDEAELRRYLVEVTDLVVFDEGEKITAGGAR